MEGRGQLLTGTAQEKYADLGAEAVNRHFLDFHSQQPTSCVEKVRSQLLSLRQIARAPAFSGRNRRLKSPTIEAISRLSFGFPIGRAGSIFSERPVSLQSSGLHRFSTVLQNSNTSSWLWTSSEGGFHTSLGRREHPISNLPSGGSIPPAPARHCDVRSGSPRNARTGRKSRLFAHLISSPDSQFGDVEAGIAETLRP
jgi:hypothetical protein